MKPDKHKMILQEVAEEIELALRDPRGLLPHQRRIAFVLSLGTVNLLEIYFHKLNLIKEGTKIDHRWFKKEKDNAKQRLMGCVVRPVSEIPNINQLLDLAYEVEKDRDNLVYGAPATEALLKKKIGLFLMLKEEAGE